MQLREATEVLKKANHFHPSNSIYIKLDRIHTGLGDIQTATKLLLKAKFLNEGNNPQQAIKLHISAQEIDGLVISTNPFKV